MYLPLSQNHETGVTLYARTSGSPVALIGAIRQSVRTVEPNLPIAEVTPVRDTLYFSLLAPRPVARLLTAFGTLALALAAVGVYGVVAFRSLNDGASSVSASPLVPHRVTSSRS